MEEPAVNPSPNLPKKSGLTELFGTILILVGVLVFLALASFQAQLQAGEAPLPEANLIGTVGHYASELLFFLFGKSAFLLGPYLFLLGCLTFYRGGFTDPLSRIVAVLVVMAGTSLVGAFLYHLDGRPSEAAGGIIGSRLGRGFQFLFGYYGGFLVSFAIFTAGLFLAIRIPIPIFLAQLQMRIMQSLRNYSDALSGDGAYGFRSAWAAAAQGNPAGSGTPAPAAAPESENVRVPTNAAATPAKPELVRLESGQRRPWVQRVILPDPEAVESVKQSAATDDEESYVVDDWSESYEDADFDDEFDGLDPRGVREARGRVDQKRLAVSRNARSLEENLERLLGQNEPRSVRPAGHPKSDARDSSESRKSSYHRREAAPAARMRRGDDESLRGFFNDDESRFHFRTTVPEPRRPRREAASFLRNRDEGREHDVSLMRSMDLNLLERRERRVAERKLPERVELNRDEITEAAFETRPNSNYDSLEANEAPPAEILPVEDAFDAEDDTIEASEAADVSVEMDNAEAGDETDDDAGVADAFEDAESDDDFEDEGPVAAAAPAPRKAKRPPTSGVPEFRMKAKRYHLPMNVLSKPERPLPQDVSREIEQTRERLEKVMQDYGIQARVVSTQRGPIITLYEVKLEPGVRVNRILSISDEIKMNLEAASVRIIAPIPGKPTVGIEIPNRNREGVVLGDMLDRDVMMRKDLCVVLGKNIAGEKQYVDLTRLPHLLIAGATGAGKSVYMNSIIASLLYTRSPEDVRFLMIDPKMVELKLYEGIPHLIMPVITDVRQASKALSWVVGEMEKRYAILSHHKCRDIRSYNERMASQARLPGMGEANGAATKMPYLVVFIDELSDLMMVAAKDVEDSIIRLTQKARAVGIHVVMATQRPSVDVITALIKANCPARIAFHVAQKTDSRTILDMNGAETLLGKGDMLYRSPSATSLTRIQAPLITEAEIEDIVLESARFGEPVYVDLDDFDDLDDDGSDESVDAELFQQAWKIVLESGKTSTSYIQRRLRIGYNRAASIIEEMERKGLLGPAVGNKPREILKRS